MIGDNEELSAIEQQSWDEIHIKFANLKSFSENFSGNRALFNKTDSQSVSSSFACDITKIKNENPLLLLSFFNHMCINLSSYFFQVVVNVK